MNLQNLQTALCGIDEKYLSEFDCAIENPKNPRADIRKILLSAACFAVVLAAVFVLRNSDVFRAPVTPSVPAENRPETILTASAVTELTQSDTTGSEDRTEKDTPIVVTPLSTQAEAAIETQPTSAEEQKGGDTSDFLQNYRLHPSDGAYYRIFHPETDIFAPNDEMTLENRFCDVNYQNRSYYPASDGALTASDYEPTSLGVTRAYSYELLTPGEEIEGIVYAARVEIYPIKDTDPSEAIACLISFNGETKAWKYLVSPITPTWTP